MNEFEEQIGCGSGVSKDLFEYERIQKLVDMIKHSPIVAGVEIIYWDDLKKMEHKSAKRKLTE